MAVTKQFQLNLDPDLYRQIADRAKDSDLTISGWMRYSFNETLGNGTTPPAFDKDHDTDRRERAVSEMDAVERSMSPIQTPDTPNVEWWSRRLKEIAAMRPVDGWSALKHASKGIEIPKYLFSNRKDLANWLAEHVK